MVVPAMENIVEASISTLSEALSSGALTSVELVEKYLLRISKYDCRNTALNSVPLINENVFHEAAAADDRRADGKAIGPLDGIPFTIKDSYKAKGMTVASGSEAFKDLIANEDAFTVRALREAGAILLGKTNMCPMAYGGMLRGLYGRAESPYNSEYLPAAFGSGSSNGSGASTAASFAAFGMGEETVSSGRSPASNNGLIAYTPSRGVISIRGNWPLYVTCDVVVPHTRTTEDLFTLLDVITQQDPETLGDFWRDQPFIKIPTLDRSHGLHVSKDKGFLNGKRIAVPEVFCRRTEVGPYVSKDVEHLWGQVRKDLEGAGATIEMIEDLPVFRDYDDAILGRENPQLPSISLPKDWNFTERGKLIAHAWEDFLEQNQFPGCTSLADTEYSKIFPQLPADNPQVKFTEPRNAVQWSNLATFVTNRPQSSWPGKSCLYDVPQLENAIRALEDIRKYSLEQWMDKHNYDLVAFPAVGDVAKADADILDASAEHAWTDGVKYSHGNRALRHLGIPSVTVPMGLLQSSRMPMGLTFLGRAYDDNSILQAAYAFEQNTTGRVPPPLTPSLRSDQFGPQEQALRNRPELSIKSSSAVADGKGNTNISLQGTISISQTRDKQSGVFEPILEILVDGDQIPGERVHISQPVEAGNGVSTSQFTCECTTPSPPTQDNRNRVNGSIARDSTMIIVLGRDSANGRPSGCLKLIHTSDQ